MIYVFGDYELDTYRYELRFRGQALRIEPKGFELLAYLIQRRGHFVSKQDLYAHLWPGQYVSESALTYCVTIARKAIGDNGRAQRCIRTVYGRGYRFIAPVEYRLSAVPPACGRRREKVESTDVFGVGAGPRVFLRPDADARLNGRDRPGPSGSGTTS